MSTALLTPGGRGLGYRRREDRPALPTLEIPQATGADLPVVVDLRHLFLPANDQGPYGTCTCNGCPEQMEVRLRQMGLAVPYHRSRSYPYYYSGKIENPSGPVEDSGRDPHDVFTAIAEHGIPPEKDWPYYPAVGLDQEPSAAAQKAAERRVFTGWANVPVQIDAIKAALAHGYTVGIAFAVWSSFESPQTLASGVVRLPEPGESLLGYHYMVLGGYTEVDLPGPIPAHSFLGLNSWGTGVGQRGWFAFPYSFIGGADPNGMPLVQELIALEAVS